MLDAYDIFLALCISIKCKVLMCKFSKKQNLDFGKIIFVTRTDTYTLFRFFPNNKTEQGFQLQAT